MTEGSKHSNEEALWQLADEMRSRPGRLDVETIIADAKKRGIPVTWKSVSYLCLRLALHGLGPAWIPAYVSDFVASYLKGRPIKRALDPFAGYGALLVHIVSECEVKEAMAVDINGQYFNLGRSISEGLPIVWVHGKAEDAFGSYAPYDLVVTAPPLNLPQGVREFTTEQGSIRITDSQTHLLTALACLLLTSDGEGVFILPNGFFHSPTLRSFQRLGLGVRAIFSLPARALFPFTNIDLNIVVIGKGYTSKWFVGQVDSGGKNEALLKNFRQRNIGPVPEFGRIVEAGRFISWRILATEEEINGLAAKGGFQAVALSEIASQINLGKRTDDGDFPDAPNSVYLPLIGNSPAVTTVSAFRIKPHNYAQIVVRPEAAFAEFVAGMFNTPLGRKVRDLYLGGAFIPKITKTSLKEATIFLLPLEAQQSVVDTHREVRDTALQLETLERSLWERPSEAARVRKALGSLNQKESFESWIETLPFPLASVLLRYDATTATEQKVAHLFNFFEACALFTGTLMLSAFHSDELFFRENKSRWFDSPEKAHSLERSSFGEWVVRAQRLAKTTRQLLSEKERRQYCLGLYKTDNPDAVETISAKDIYSALESANRYRSDWKGHGGIAGAGENARRLTLLETELSRIRDELGAVFENWWLLRPGKSEFSRSIYQFTAERLLGSRQIFKEVQVLTPSVMDRNELYTFDPSTREPLLLLPFFRILPSPKTEENACYFYNRVQKEAVRWVSYHFEQEAEILRPDESLLKVIAEIESRTE